MTYQTGKSTFAQQSLTTSPDSFSDEAWLLLLEGESEARRWRHEYLDTEHIIQVLFSNRKYANIVNALPIDNVEVLDELEGFLANIELSNSEQLFIGEDLEILLDSANTFRGRWGSKFIEISHLLIAIARDNRIGTNLFKQLGLTSEILEGELKKIPKQTKKAKSKRIGSESSYNGYKSNNHENLPPKSEQIELNNEALVLNSGNELSIEEKSTALDIYGNDLTLAAKEGKLDPVIGRDMEIQLAIKVLSRRGKNNPVLIGSPGVGKTAIAELLAQRIVKEEVPDSIKGLKLISLDIGALIAGTKFRGQFEERLRSVLKEASDPNAGVVLFIDELDTILNTERSSTDAGNLLKPVLANGEIRCIGATTPDNYRRTIEKDQALNRRFQKVLIKEPSIDLSVEILRGIKERYETHHEVKISDEALITANRLADRYISDRCLPDKAIDLIDEAAAQIKMESTSKPKIIEETELGLKQLENILLNDKGVDPLINIEEINREKDLSTKKLEELMQQWSQEKSILEELRDLSQQEKYIKESVEEAQQQGELEEAARLQFDELHHLERKISSIYDELNELKDSGQLLIKDQVEPEDIGDVVARWTGIPVNKVLAGEKQKLLDLDKELSTKVIGQSEAVDAVAAAIKRARAGMKDSRRPIGSFLFLGPTGVGKTELAKTLAASLFDEQEALVRLDMSEFMERNAVARLIGAPPGYVGYEQGGQLTEYIRRRPYSVLLLDEVEKAHPDVFNILLQVLDDGRLTDSQGRTIDFRHTVVVMTSNLASRKILESAKLSKDKTLNNNEIEENLNQSIDEALSKHFRPEFLNRIDEVIRFSPLTTENLKQIIQLQLTELSELLAEQNLELIIDKTTIETLALEAYEPEYGARPLRRILRRRLENPLATKLLEDKFIGSKAIRVTTSQDNASSLEFFPEN
ncbi:MULTISPECIES: ATP-dependent Clp protease ATP-binding subunit [Prochlorococcus]|uniref:ATPases with chaperone activity, ATP-binding subunit n=1 Tax=Prochlorococcus marinus (strain SARG / CCMP1375 / SS120) TaxID=167539 RepID=Q7VDY2_PROMA|nr:MULTISPECIES: AAA family ATPase [Prochlorococcus]AAP99279.1 ATPases with chaperone activity, ATP-binding subunit [Prochlorococcus marinus subsp. marinus str. CCMP1375]KGG11451.1 ClpB protein [Prochlorococcus marinus str. LG]KGG18594.1 ClpB protein [Prochlorococcus marinus str. SS2]KGG22867.1 ClpB protein [Prochlorococcus marinus str. SS35]KGG32743.1 ClpB protein [Prochlorococcus marinus str. SS51]